MKKINIKFGDKLFCVDEGTTLEDFLKHQKLDTRNLATSINADLILKDKRKDAEQMHSFLWLSLIDRKTDHTKIKKIIYIWMFKNSKYKKKTWEPSILSTRIISWILNIDIILNNSTFDFRRNFLNCIISQTNHLCR